MKFSLVIPCYNEAANLPLLLNRCKKLAHQPDCEVILVDNGSTDGSSDVLLELLPNYPGCRSIRIEKNIGYGNGIFVGLKAAKGNILGWTHADMQTDPLDAIKGLEIFEKYGNKIFIKGLRYGRPLSDVVFTVGMSLFESVLLGKKLWDINAQPTMFSRDFFESWQEPPYDFSLDLFAYYKARQFGLKVHRFSVRFGERAHGESSWNVNWAAKRKFIKRTLEFSLKLKKNL